MFQQRHPDPTSKSTSNTSATIKNINPHQILEDFAEESNECNEKVREIGNDMIKKSMKEQQIEQVCEIYDIKKMNVIVLETMLMGLNNAHIKVQAESTKAIKALKYQIAAKNKTLQTKTKGDCKISIINSFPSCRGARERSKEQ